MKKSLYLIPIVIVAVIAIGYGFTKTKTSDKEAQSTTASDATVNMEEKSTDGGRDHEAEHGVKLAGTRIDLQNAASLKPGEVTLAFKLYGIDAHEFGPNDLKIAHEKLMHLILVRDDATGFQHVHPEYQNGRWIVVTTIPNQGAYQMYVDVDPKEEKPVTLRVPLTIGGTTEAAQFPSVSANMSANVGDIQVTLELTAPLKTKEHTTLTFALTQNGKSVTQIDPYLGAFGHVVVLRHTDADDYLHGHPITASKPAGGKVVFESEFPVKGTYTIFAQFSIRGQVKIFPITVSVETEGEADDDHQTTDANTTGKQDASH